MRDKWILKQDLARLRKTKGLSMEALAALAFTTNTTIYRIEKTGVIADFSLAERLASIFDVSLDEFCSEDFASVKAEAEWKRQLVRPYQTEPEPQSKYYLAFVRRYEKRGEYSVASPTSWIGAKDGKERRKLLMFYPEGIIEHLKEYGVNCAVVHDALGLIYFYYGIPANEERAVLIREDIVADVYPDLRSEYLCETNRLPCQYDFKDLVQVDLRSCYLPSKLEVV